MKYLVHFTDGTAAEFESETQEAKNLIMYRVRGDESPALDTVIVMNDAIVNWNTVRYIRRMDEG